MNNLYAKPTKKIPKKTNKSCGIFKTSNLCHILHDQRFFLFKKKKKNGWTVVGINVGAAPWVDVIAGLEVLLGNPVGEDAHLMWLIDWYLIDWRRLLPQSTLSFPLSDKENGLVELFHFFRLLNEEGWISDAGMLLNSLLAVFDSQVNPTFKFKIKYHVT